VSNGARGDAAASTICVLLVLIVDAARHLF
jgi:hypothetical protein